MRRVSLDLTGTLPTVAEARAFLADADPAKRARLVDALLEPYIGKQRALITAEEAGSRIVLP